MNRSMLAAIGLASSVYTVKCHDIPVRRKSEADLAEEQRREERRAKQRGYHARLMEKQCAEIARIEAMRNQ